MTKRELFEILGDIDTADAKPSKSFKWVKWVSVAACFLIIAAVSIPIINSVTSSEPEMLVLMPSTQNEEFSQQAIHLPNQPYRGPEITEDVPADVSGTPVAEATVLDDLSKEASDIFCGSYIENGNYVVVLTEDTPDNRALICRELGRNETTVTFKTGTYTLLYLTELQNKISSEMVNKNLPSVASSAVMETSNRIEVSVISDNGETAKKLQKLDTIGGAIEVKEVCAYPTADVHPID